MLEGVRGQYLLGVLTLSGLLATLVACQGNPSRQVGETLPNAPGKLLYAKNGELWTLEPSSGTQRQVATLPPQSLRGTLTPSPDGALIVYGVYQPGQNARDAGGVDLYLMAADGSNQRLLVRHDAPGVFLGEPAWTPDAGAIYFTRRTLEGGSAIGRVEVTGIAQGATIKGGGNPALSTDGERLAYVVTDSKSYTQALWVADTNGTNAKQVAGAPQFQALNAVRFSPDGKQIAFAAIVASQDSSTVNPTGALRGLWAWLKPQSAYAHPVRVPWDLWLANTDGAGLRRLTDQGDEVTMPAWSPDGQWIAFSSEVGLFAIDIEGKQLRRLTQDLIEGGLIWLRK